MAAPPRTRPRLPRASTQCYVRGAVTVDDRDIRFGHDRDIRFGHDLDEVQDEHGVDLALLRANLALSVEERLRALEECIRFAESVRPVARTRSEP